MHLREIIIGFLIMCLIVMGFITYKLVHYYYGKELLIRLNPIHERNNIRVVNTEYWFLGDSRIEQWKSINEVIPDKNFCNLGIDSQSSAQVLERLKYYFKTNSAKYVFIQTGINDLKVIGFYPDREKQIIEFTTSNIKTLLDLCLQNGAIPIFMTIFPTGKVEIKRKLFWNSNVEKAIVNVNGSILSYCNNLAIPVFDSYQMLLNKKDGRLKNDFEADCLHLNSRGYSYLLSELERFLEQEIQ
jgi:lysophospholipase L1-like esterase